MSKDIVRKVLIVEDDSAIIDVYKTVMEKSNLQAEVASSGSEAMRIVKEIADGQQEAPDIILLDLILPDVNGMDILKEIRNNEKTKNIKVFIFSNQEPSSQSSDLGAIKPDKFIIKSSIAPTELVKIINKEFE